MRVIVLVGLPASGKSTWAAAQGHGVLSSDSVRHLLSGDETNQAIHAAVFTTLRYLLRKRLELGAPATIIDATNLLPKHRKPWIKVARAHHAEVEAVYFPTPLDECLRRNATRPRVVPAAAIAGMAAHLTPPNPAEGFTKVTVIPSMASFPASASPTPASVSP